MCRFEPEGIGTRKVCTSDGDMLACQLCPNSPGYWRNTTAPAAADPWDGRPAFEVPDIDETGWRDDRTPLPEDRRDWPRILESMRCVICRIPTPWISPKGTRCHPSCARKWLRERARRSTATA